MVGCAPYHKTTLCFTVGERIDRLPLNNLSTTDYPRKVNLAAVRWLQVGDPSTSVIHQPTTQTHPSDGWRTHL